VLISLPAIYLIWRNGPEKDEPPVAPPPPGRVQVRRS